MSYPYELACWAKAGFPVRSPERVEELFDDVCSPCQHYAPITEQRGKCELCGCNIKRNSGAPAFNKLEWATTRCPAKPPKWNEEINATTQ